MKKIFFQPVIWCKLIICISFLLTFGFGFYVPSKLRGHTGLGLSVCLYRGGRGLGTGEYMIVKADMRKSVL